MARRGRGRVIVHPGLGLVCWPEVKLTMPEMGFDVETTRPWWRRLIRR
jgi:hypothetical protein